MFKMTSKNTIAHWQQQGTKNLPDRLPVSELVRLYVVPCSFKNTGTNNVNFSSWNPPFLTLVFELKVEVLSSSLIPSLLHSGMKTWQLRR